MIHGLMMTPPVVGRIAIGKMVERNGKRLPEKDDEFTITTQVQNRHGWVRHPIDAVLRAGLVSPADQPRMAAGAPAIESAEALSGGSHPAKHTLQSKLARRAHEQRSSTAPTAVEAPGSAVLVEAFRPPPAGAKLRNIPVRLLFHDPALNLRANYTLFDRAKARPVCVGDGKSCKRRTAQGIETMPCEGPDLCALAIEGGCKPFGRFHARIDHPENLADAMSTFVLRTTGINSLRTLLTRMQYLQAASGGLLAYLPLELRLRAKSTAQSRRTPIYYVDLGIRDGLPLDVAIGQAIQADAYARKTGYDQQALEVAARKGYALGLFEELEQEATDIAREFYPPGEGGPSEGVNDGPAPQA